MKTHLYSLAFFTLVFSSCQKEITFENQPNRFYETKYLSLGDWDESGKPKYLLTRESISSEMFSFINERMAEAKDIRESHPEIYKSPVEVSITRPSDVFLTFVSQTTSFTDAIAFYTYPTDQPPADLKSIPSITYIFPNAGNGTPLQSGDKVKLGRFNAGVSIGLVLLQSGWSPNTHLVNKTATHFFTNDNLNPEPDPNLKKHAIALPYPFENKLLIGFEDLLRTESNCDHDFEDVLVYLTVAP